MGNKLGFRGWFYFRQGWSTYFAFIFAAINTMVVTYYLAIENIPALKQVFPTFYIYLLVVASIGIPLLIVIGYIHFKRTKAYEAEADIVYESNPFALRTIINTEISIQLILKLSENILKLSNNQELTEKELEETKNIHNELQKYLEERSFKNKKDLDYFKKLTRS